LHDNGKQTSAWTGLLRIPCVGIMYYPASLLVYEHDVHL